MESQRSAAQSADLGVDDLSARVCLCVAEALKVETTLVTGDRTLLELGAQSFDFMKILFRLEKVFAVRLPRSLAVPGHQAVSAYVAAVRDASAAIAATASTP